MWVSSAFRAGAELESACSRDTFGQWNWEEWRGSDLQLSVQSSLRPLSLILHRGAFFNRKGELFYETYFAFLSFVLLPFLSFISHHSFCISWFCCTPPHCRVFWANDSRPSPPSSNSLFLRPCLSVPPLICLLCRITYLGCSVGSCLCEDFRVVIAVKKLIWSYC